MIKFKFADIAEGLESGKIVEFFVKEGDEVEEGDDLFLVETDKVSSEISSPCDGKIVKIYFTAGSEVKVGEVVMDIDDGKPSADAEEAPAEKTKQEQPTTVASVVGAVEVGNEVLPPPPTPVTTATPIPQPAPTKPPVAQTPKTPLVTPLAGKIAAVGQIDLNNIATTSDTQRIQVADIAPLANIESNGLSLQPKQKSTSVASSFEIKATPFLRKWAADHQVDLSLVAPTGPDKQIILPDVQRFLDEQKTTATSAPATKPTPTQTATAVSGSSRVVPLTGIRNAIAKQMTLAKSQIPETTLMREANISELVKVRVLLKEQAAKENIKLTFMAFFIRACCIALKQMPIINSSFDADKRVIIYKNFINIGIAVDTDYGLMVPVIKNAAQQSILKLAQSVVDLASRARVKKLKITEMQQGTFTITNYGSVGIEFATPVINFPEVAILGVGSFKKRPVIAPDGEIVPGVLVPLSLTIDHRVIDGADGARFLNIIIDILENPTKLMLL